MSKSKATAVLKKNWDRRNYGLLRQLRSGTGQIAGTLSFMQHSGYSPQRTLCPGKCAAYSPVSERKRTSGGRQTKRSGHPAVSLPDCGQRGVRTFKSARLPGKPLVFVCDRRLRGDLGACGTCGHLYKASDLFLPDFRRAIHRIIPISDQL